MPQLDDNNPDLMPKELWVEAIYVKPRFPWSTRNVVGSQLCIHLSFVENSVFNGAIDLFDLEMYINGEHVKNIGGLRDRDGFTFTVPIESDDRFSDDGTVSIAVKSKNVESICRYRLRKK